jgi:hypothetical protein
MVDVESAVPELAEDASAETVTLKLHSALLLDASKTDMVTVVEPTGKTSPDW